MANQVSKNWFLYENSFSYQGYLIIPFVLNKVEAEPIYSYTLLSELGHKGQFHNVENPADFYSSTIFNIIKAARKHLEEHSDVESKEDYFKCRYTYYHNLIVIHKEGAKCFYDHYPPDKLNNIAAPKLFKSEIDCISWVKQGLERNRVGQVD
jgi:hypothetical protein